MNKVALFASLCIALACCHGCQGLFTWLFSRNKDRSDDNKGKTESSSPMPSDVPFEMTVIDEEFALQTEFIKHLSPLDACHHKTIAEIQGTCSDLSEEELGKLSVQLLNCQLEAEKRPVYPCKASMTLADCTQDMDSTVWNAYQIVSNRARAVCYSARQQQFRARTELTVNSLVHTTRDQLMAMKAIQENQQDLRDKTERTLQDVQNGQDRLVASQSHIQQAQSLIHGHVSSNLQALMREKALIATGNKELAEMTQAIKEKLDATSEQLELQEFQQKANHKEILDDLSRIQERAQQVWTKIDESSQRVLQYHGETREHYKDTLNNLAVINSTISGVAALLLELRAYLDERITWLASVVGTTGDHMSVVKTLTLHAGYLLLASISASFLHTPFFSRVVLLLIVPLNAWVSMSGHSPALGFTTMTMFILLTVLGNWCVHWLVFMWAFCQRRRRSVPTHSPQKSLINNNHALRLCNGHSDLTNGVVPSSLHMSESPSRLGLATPDFKRLVSVLEKIYQSGVLSPACDQKIASETSDMPDMSSAMEEDNCVEEVEVTTPDQCLSSMPLNPHPTPVTDVQTASVQRPHTPTVELVRRDLLHAMSADTHLRKRDSSPDAVRKTTDPLTDSPLINSSPRGSRSSTPTRISSKAICLSTTRAGRSCRLSSVEGSAFCHLHQVSS